MKSRQLIIQAAIVGALLLLAAALVSIVTTKMRALGVEPGFGFLLQRAGFDIGDRWMPFDATDTYARAFAVGLFNTVRVALVAMIASVIFGGLLGLGQLAKNPILAKLCEAYVEVFRNVPLLLQLLIVYVLLIGRLPLPHEAWQLAPDVWLSKSGLAFPWLISTAQGWQVEAPVLGVFTFSGGAMLTPEFIAVAIGLTLYTSAYIAETVRGSVIAVSRGQTQAAVALGLNEVQTLRFVIVPQALRSMIPPLSNQLLNLLKNSSLAVAIGYPDLVAVADTALNQSSHAVECIAIIMAVYLFLSLLTAALMALWHARLLHRQAGGH
ncbi:MAG TPA: ABC transporter permease subunit [Rhodocyclaceae bacterium]|jgi:general L-amino acid transport system permease protein|nr:ABC transporter permease subunit [Rhodocyclaceae bacterium]